MVRCVYISEVVEIIEVIPHGEPLPEGVALASTHQMIWRAAFELAKQAKAWGNAQCKILKANYPERDYGSRVVTIPFVND